MNVHPAHGGTFRDRHGTGRGLRWTLRRQACSHAGRKRRSGRRSRVVLAPRPWRHVGGSFPPATGARKAASPGRARISRKTIARGKPGCLGCTCQTRVHSFASFAHGNAGAPSARLSLRPLFGEGQRNCRTRVKTSRGNESACLSASLRAKRSNPASLSRNKKAGLLRRFAPRNDAGETARLNTGNDRSCTGLPA
jgi:hypothetical protein